MRITKSKNGFTVFSSDIYYSVNIIVVYDSGEAVIFDTGVSENEFQFVLEYIEEKEMFLKYIVYSHFHFDHNSCNIFMDNVPVISHEDYLLNFEQAMYNVEDVIYSYKKQYISMLPTITFTKKYNIIVGSKCIELIHSPGHTSDSIVAVNYEDEYIIAGDTVNLIPYIKWGNINQLKLSLRFLLSLDIDEIIMGHFGLGHRVDILKNLVYLERIEGFGNNIFYREKNKICINTEMLQPELFMELCDIPEDEYIFIRDLHYKNMFKLINKTY
ncbi:MBL fold metallo-hydrolase [Anaeromicropila populeti]|uniref:Glyoxylase, beta-lactamase superfamily II n=1 Tax=Anaeromicropila populeti TaxID=37658 RepID=A0A1I6LVU2_9FIRM|nr:MBL fold metallo-hydrolase [Anaeromicropila populeti]SFS07538.1 Glyoxylase, beta-lactamase superfamily II [Anaeromicropila populeti]